MDGGAGAGVILERRCGSIYNGDADILREEAARGYVILPILYVPGRGGLALPRLRAHRGLIGSWVYTRESILPLDEINVDATSMMLYSPAGGRAVPADNAAACRR